MSEQTIAKNVPVLDSDGFLAGMAGDTSAYYEEIRAIGDVVFEPMTSAYLVSSHELVRQMAKGDGTDFNPASVYDERFRPMGLSRDEYEAVYGCKRYPITIGGAEHKMQHRWWTQALSVRVLASWANEYIVPVAHEQIDRFIDAGHAELREEYADRVGPRVIAAILGLPWEDDEMIKDLVDIGDAQVEFMTYTGVAAPPEVVARATKRIGEGRELLMPYVRERKSGEGTDFISLVWRDAEQIFGPDYDYTEVDVAAIAQASAAAGTDTTSATTASGLYLLLNNPGLADKLRAGGSEAIQVFVEEALRLQGPVQFLARRALRDVELGEVTIPEGSLVLAMMTAANRDPAHYGCPVDIDMDRERPRDHFAFYGGPRVCPGQGLARIQLEHIFTAILDRIDDMKLDPGKPPPEYVGFGARRWSPLHATFRRRES
jgi:cytochrome P450